MNEPKICACGCGRETLLAARTYTAKGIRKSCHSNYDNGRHER